MKKNLLIIMMICLCYGLKAQQSAQPVILGHIDTLHSAILNEKRPIWVYTPGYDTSYFSKPGYPVLYVLDGDGYFLSLVTMLQQLSRVNGNTVLPEMIIVGIPNIRGSRTRDLTPSKSAMETSGGGENFTGFMEKELIPYIDKNYATAPYRVLAGHSLGGLMVINTLINHTALFNAYIALDPSMFYDNDRLLLQTSNALKQKSFKGRSLFLAIANTMNPGMDTTQVRTDTAELTHHIRSILKLKDELKSDTGNNLRWAYKYYPNDDHASVPFIGFYDGLRFIFAENRFPRNQPQNQFFDKSLTAGSLKQMIIAHYKLLSRDMGYNVRPPEALMNQMGYTFLQLKDYERSAMFFGLNIDYYPASFNTYDGMGDYYLAVKNKAEAMAYFKKALSLKNTLEIRVKLDKLEAERKN